MNMSSVAVDVAPMYAAYAGGASDDIAVDAAGFGSVHVGAGAATTGLATGASTTGEGWAADAGAATTGLATGASATGEGWAAGVTCCMGTI